METAQRVAIEFECLKLCHAFAYYIDHGNFEAMVNLFAPDGVFDRDGVTLRGRQQIREAMSKRPPVTTRHLVTNFLPLEVNASRVKSSVYNLSIHSFDPSEGVKKFSPAAGTRLLEFSDEFQLTPDGWRFASRIARPVMVVPEWPGS
ncbi:MAG: nuclear transport factor 2 family protein [Candidatus Binataceae bacterium]